MLWSIFYQNVRLRLNFTTQTRWPPIIWQWDEEMGADLANERDYHRQVKRPFNLQSGYKNFLVFREIENLPWLENFKLEIYELS